MAKQQYFNSMAAGTFSNYDEKVMGIMTLYGLPMMRVNMPITTTAALAGPAVAAAPNGLPVDTFTSTVTLSYDFAAHTIVGLGDYYTVAGDNEVYVAGARPIQPRDSLNVAVPGTIAHGVLLLGGSFTDVPDFNPAVSRVLTDDTYSIAEPLFASDYWSPVGLGTINRFWGIDGRSFERLVVVPGQFKADAANPEIGTERLYTNLTFEVYHTPVDNTDFVAPQVWQVEAQQHNGQTSFRVMLTDDDALLGGKGPRVLVLYRNAASNTWHSTELSYDSLTGWARGTIAQSGQVDYFVQAVDASGNVALALDHGNPFTVGIAGNVLYLPVVKRP